MEKKIRVAPKNIQFKKDIQMKEIPSRHDDMADATRRPSWNPNLQDTGVLKPEPKTGRNVIIGFVISGIVVVVIIIAVALGVIMSQKGTTVADNSVTYGNKCTVGSNQCIASQGLYCPNGFCSCNWPYSWNTATQTCTLLTYNQACSSSNQCNSSLGLSCISSTCQCGNYHSWNSTNNTCVIILNNTVTYGGQCAAGWYHCISSIELTCPNGTCQCITTKAWNISQCSCPTGTFLNSSNLCQPLLKHNQTCVVGSRQCDTNRGLSCNNSVCVCAPNQYWNTNFEVCMPRVNYSGACSVDSDCVPTLICPTVAGICNCSLFLADYTCNCANTQYYDSTIQQCVNRATFGGVCTSSANYTCGLSLYCNVGTCSCPTGTTWISANSTCL